MKSPKPLPELATPNLVTSRLRAELVRTNDWDDGVEGARRTDEARLRF